MKRALATALSLLLAVPAHGQEPPGDEKDDLPPGSTVADYFAEMERLGLVDRSAGSPELLARELDRAEAALEAGDAVGAAVQLYALVESPRYTDFSDSPEYQNAEYDLSVALFRTGAYDAALAMPSPAYLPQTSSLISLLETLEASLFEPDPIVVKPSQ